MASAFHLIALPTRSEEAAITGALDALVDVEPGESVFFSEAVAWTAEGSGVAFMKLVKAARLKNVNLIGSLNLGGELTEDLPGHDPARRYHALVVFTRHGHVHVPQAKCFPEAFERAGAPGDEAGPISPYNRSNLVRLDMDEQLIEVRFMLGADLHLIGDGGPGHFACDVLFSMARMPYGADEAMRETLADARKYGLCSTTVQLNGILEKNAREGICKKIEEARDLGRSIRPKPRWPQLAKMRNRYYRYGAKRGQSEPATAIEKLARDKKRKDRIPLCRPPRDKKITPGLYPVTIVL